MTIVDPIKEVAPVDPNIVNITINEKPVVARKGELIIAAADRTEDFIPRFCYHPRMAPVGMCRQCLVEVETPRGPMMVVSCMTPVAEGQIVRTATDGVKKAQEGVLELLLANHPLDCPVCDKGGECPLQDQAFSHGPGESRFVEEKRHYEKPIAISDIVYLDRERCILCDRCTRFADEVAGDALITFTSRGNDTQVLTFPDEPFSSYFSGNTVQICPVGALTAKPYRFKARPWDLEQIESTCTSCSVGCRTVVQSSRDELVRYQGVDIDPVNWGWLCDRGRYNFESVNSPDRLTTPLIKNGSELVATSWSVALENAGRMIRLALAQNPNSVAILGGARGTNEDAFAWAMLADKLGINQRDAQLGDGLSPEIFKLDQATIDQTCAASTIVLLAPDLKEELPVLYLRLRDAAQKRKSRIIEFSSRDSGLTPYAWRSVGFEPGSQAQTVRDALATQEMKEQISRGEVVVVVGRQNLAESEVFTLQALAEVFVAAPNAKVLPVLRRGNVRGAVVAGLTPKNNSGDAIDILNSAAAGKIDCLILLGADPISDVADSGVVQRALAQVKNLISVDTMLNNSNRKADVVLPAAAYGEKNGTTTNLEGRISNVVQKITPRGTSRPDWMIATELSIVMGADIGVSSLEDLSEKLVGTVAAFAPSSDAKSTNGDGVLMARETPVTISGKAVKAVDRNAYNYRLVVSRTMYDTAQSTVASPSLVGIITDSAIFVNPLDLARIGVVEGASVRVGADGTNIVIAIKAHNGVRRGSAWLPFNHRGVDIRPLLNIASDVVDVRIEPIK
ncbi:MAG: NADH dehydrogenase (quinone) subunit G [Actinobacteria bacterium]|nr:NADH dehydrogenase (quinone) subunit G [Actinomycetota bacterium]NDF66699.1 NADH dehydrogenase (quinone) subunit G [Actinomycetota bacterium]